MTEKSLNIVNAQINEEFYSAYLYLAFSAKLENWGLKGAASWMMIQAKEELDHALGFVKFLTERNQEVKLETITKPENDIKNILEIFKAGLAHEQHITERIGNIYEIAKAEKDHALESFIKWYIDEQVEEEANANEIIDKLKLIGNEGSAVYLIDQELAARTYLPSGPYAAKA